MSCRSGPGRTSAAAGARPWSGRPRITSTGYSSQWVTSISAKRSHRVMNIRTLVMPRCDREWAIMPMRP
eukprot:8918662-Pyramimonas_sp.AAC.1